MNKDLQLLQGAWRQVKFEENGLVDPADTHSADGAILTVSGTTFHVAVPGGEALIEGIFDLDSAASPKRIDWIDSIGEDKGKRLPSIYALSVGTFEFAAADAGMDRPHDFAGGEGITVRGFVRA